MGGGFLVIGRKYSWTSARPLREGREHLSRSTDLGTSVKESGLRRAWYAHSQDY